MLNSSRIPTAIFWIDRPSSCHIFQASHFAGVNFVRVLTTTCSFLVKAVCSPTLPSRERFSFCDRCLIVWRRWSPCVITRCCNIHQIQLVFQNMKKSSTRQAMGFISFAVKKIVLWNLWERSKPSQFSKLHDNWMKTNFITSYFVINKVILRDQQKVAPSIITVRGTQYVSLLPTIDLFLPRN